MNGFPFPMEHSASFVSRVSANQSLQIRQKLHFHGGTFHFSVKGRSIFCANELMVFVWGHCLVLTYYNNSNRDPTKHTSREHRD
jgi:hypothetical protein